MAASTRNASQRSGATTRSRAEGRRYQPPTPKPRKKKAKKKAPTPPAATAAAPSPAPAVVSPAPVQAPQVRVDTQGQVADSATDEEASQGAPVEFDYGDNFILNCPALFAILCRVASRVHLASKALSSKDPHLGFSFMARSIQIIGIGISGDSSVDRSRSR